MIFRLDKQKKLKSSDCETLSVRGRFTISCVCVGSVLSLCDYTLCVSTRTGGWLDAISLQLACICDHWRLGGGGAGLRALPFAAWFTLKPLPFLQENFGMNSCKDLAPEFLALYKNLMLVRTAGPQDIF